MLVADEVKKYADPLYAESDGFMPVAVKLQLLLSKEEDIKKALEEEKIGEPVRTPNGLLESRYFLNLLQFIGV